MEAIQDQVSALDIKVDALHRMIEQLSYQTTEVLSALKRLNGERLLDSAYEQSQGRLTYHAYQSRYSSESTMDHKDILSDSAYSDSDSHSGERNLTPEIQIQRLTAQLTAAYNRIAALEEQLIAKRIH